MKLQKSNNKKLFGIIGVVIAVAAAVAGVAVLLTKFFKRRNEETEYIECDGVCSDCDEDCDAKFYIDDDDVCDDAADEDEQDETFAEQGAEE